jgi:hypothetical protein
MLRVRALSEHEPDLEVSVVEAFELPVAAGGDVGEQYRS